MLEPTTIKPTEPIYDEKCNAECVLKQAYDKCERNIAVLTVADDQRIKDNKLAQSNVFEAGFTNVTENEFRYPTVPRDFGNCDRLRPKKSSDALLKVRQILYLSVPLGDWLEKKKTQM